MKKTKQMSPGMKFFIAKILPIILLVIGLLMTLYGARTVLRAQASKKWPTVQGEVVMSSMDSFISKSTSGTSRRHSRSTSASGGKTMYHAEILYEFAVNGTNYKGNDVSFGDYDSSSPAPIQRIINRYPVGEIVKVFYMPGNPEVCILEPGVKALALIVPGIGLAFVISGIWAFIFHMMKGKKENMTESV